MQGSNTLTLNLPLTLAFTSHISMYFTLDGLLYYTDRKDVVEPLYKKYKSIKAQVGNISNPNKKTMLLMRRLTNCKYEILAYSERSWEDIVL